MTEDQKKIDKLWYTRCNVPTATGLAYQRGWLAKRFAEDDMELGILQDAPIEIARHHYDHALPGLFREGGSVPAIVAKSDGQPTRLIGLTWIDERQAIVVRADIDTEHPSGLKGRRIVIPGWAKERHASHSRAMALAGFEAALGIGGLDFQDVTVVEAATGKTIPPGRLRDLKGIAQWPALNLLVEGEADAAYVKGAAAIAAARKAGLCLLIDLDHRTVPEGRVNNGTPRPITVHEALLQSRPEWVIDFLALTLKAAEWASGHPDDVRSIVRNETQAGTIEDIDSAYGHDFQNRLAADLSPERLKLLDIQVDFLRRHDFLKTSFKAEAWADADVFHQALIRLETIQT